MFVPCLYLLFIFVEYERALLKKEEPEYSLHVFI